MYRPLSHKDMFNVYNKLTDVLRIYAERDGVNAVEICQRTIVNIADMPYELSLVLLSSIIEKGITYDEWSWRE